MNIELPAKAWIQSERYAEHVIEMMKKRIPGYGSNGFVFRWQYLAERALRLILEESERLHEHNLETCGYPEAMPFEVWNNDGFHQVAAVRISHLPHYSDLILQGKEKRDGGMFVEVKMDYYVACRCLTKTPEDGNPIPIKIEGFATKKQMKEAPIIGPGAEFKKPIRKIGYEKLNDIEDLLNGILHKSADPEQKLSAYYEERRRKTQK